MLSISKARKVVETSEAIKKLLTLPERVVEHIAKYAAGRGQTGQRFGRGFSETFYILLTLGTVFVAAFLLGGGMYIAIYSPSFLVAGQGPLGAMFIYRGNSLEETFLEGIFISMLYITSVAGMYLIYRSTRYSHSPRTMWMIFIIGFFLLVFGISLIYQTGRWKIG
jgi:hypothetical protein